MRTTIFQNFTCLIFHFSLGLLFVSLESAEASVRAGLYDDSGQEIGHYLTIGNTLHVGLQGAEPWKLYQIVLRDPTGLQIAATAGRADGVGFLEPAGLFVDSGVTPCAPPGVDPTTPETPSEYQFPNLPEANMALAGLQFQVEISDLWTAALVASRQVVMSVDPNPYFYFSDRGACLRRNFAKGEYVYLSGVNALPETLYRVFVLATPEKEDWEDGYDFEEAREWLPCPGPSSLCPEHPEGTLFEIDGPLTTRVVSGPFPSDLDLIALVRIAVDEVDTQRLLCDQATQRSVIVDRSNPAGEGHSVSWTCPPCPPDEEP